LTREVQIKGYKHVPRWKGNIQEASPTKYLEELTHFFKTIGAPEEDYKYILSKAINESAKGWFHLVKEQISCYQDFCYKFIKKYADRKSIERTKKRVWQDKPNWYNVN